MNNRLMSTVIVMVPPVTFGIVAFIATLIGGVLAGSGWDESRSMAITAAISMACLALFWVWFEWVKEGS